MPYTYLPPQGMPYLTVNGGQIQFWRDGQLQMTMTPEEARSNAADLIEAANRAEGKGEWAAPPPGLSCPNCAAGAHDLCTMAGCRCACLDRKHRKQAGSKPEKKRKKNGSRDGWVEGRPPGSDGAYLVRTTSGLERLAWFNTRKGIWTELDGSEVVWVRAWRPHDKARGEGGSDA